MGYMQAMSMAETETPIEVQLEWHLTSNHYPPIPTFMVAVALKAITAASAGDWGELIELPDGVSYKDMTEVSASAIVEHLHLEPWIGGDEE